MKHVHFDKSPMGFHVYQEGEKHPVGWLKQASGYGSNDYYIIHNRLKADKRGTAFPLREAKKLITKLINGEG